MSTQTFTGVLTVLDCANCGITFGITEQFEGRRREDHQAFYCPSGHSLSFEGKTEMEKQLDAANRRARDARASEQFYREQAALERRRAAAQKGQRTRVLNLITKGICPVAGCRRNFTNVRDHMATQHPDFHAHEEPS